MISGREMKLESPKAMRKRLTTEKEAELAELADSFGVGAVSVADGEGAATSWCARTETILADIDDDTPIFAVARIAGWAAHHDEELGERPVRYRGLTRHR